MKNIKKLLLFVLLGCSISGVQASDGAQPETDASADQRGILVDAIQAKQVDVVRQILESGFAFTDIDGEQNILHEAVESESPEIVRLLLEHGAFYMVDYSNQQYRSSFTLALDLGNTEVVRAFVEFETDEEMYVNADSLRESITSGNFELFQLVWGYIQAHESARDNYEKYDDRESFLYDAACLDRRNIVSLLLDSGADPDVAGFSTPLIGAIQHNHYDMVVLLLDRHVNPNGISVHQGADTYPLVLAMIQNKTEIVSLLLSRGANPLLSVNYGLSALYFAVNTNNIPLVQSMLSCVPVASRTMKNYMPLFTSTIIMQNLEVLRLLFGSVTVVKLKGNMGRQLLTHAIISKGYPIINYLITMGASINIEQEHLRSLFEIVMKNNDYRTATVIATRLKQKKVFAVAPETFKNKIKELWRKVFTVFTVEKEFILENGEIVTKPVPLEQVHMVSFVRAFLNLGVDVMNHCDGSGETALHRAVTLGYVDLVKLLLQAGAQVNPQNQYGISPLCDIFVARDRTDIAAFILAEYIHCNIVIDHEAEFRAWTERGDSSDDSESESEDEDDTDYWKMIKSSDIRTMVQAAKAMQR